MKKVDKLTPEQEANLAVYRDKWIRLALSTGRMTPDERSEVDRCVRALYAHAKLPAPKAVVVVPSPLVLTFAGGAASWWWYCKRNGASTREATWDATGAATQAATWEATWAATEGATRNATDAATRNATRNATETATWEATWAATEGATLAATRNATRNATDAATRNATRNATEGATLAATRNATRNATEGATLAATRNATRNATETEALKCAARWINVVHGGNLWAGYESYLDFWSTILRDRPDCRAAFAKWDDWRRLAEISGYRWMSPDFCLVSEKPVKLVTEEIRGVHRPHCEDGPSHLWADGFAIWHWHGVRVPRQVIEAPETITVEQIKSEQNAEVRRVMRERFGEGAYLIATGAKVIDSDHETTRKGAAPRCLVEDSEGQRSLVGTDGSTKRTYYMRVNGDVQTCRQAHESLCGFDETKIVNKS